MKTLLPLLLLALGTTTASAQTTHTVQLTFSGGSAFSPDELTIDLGDTVRFDWISGFHNVESFQGLFFSGAPQVGPNTFDVVFDQAYLTAAQNAGVFGTSFDYFCNPHLAGGMVGNITVRLSGQPVLEVTALNAGSSATIQVSQAAPGATVGVAYSLAAPGTASLPVGPCGQMVVELTQPITVAAIATANASGVMSFTTAVPASAFGVFVNLQGAEINSCTLSNSGTWRIR